MITVDELKRYCEGVANAREKVEQAKEILKSCQLTVDECEIRLLAALEESKLKTFKNELGSFTIKNTESVKIPHGEQKDEFFRYLQDRGMFEALATIHSKTLNSWYNEESKKDPFFKAPGLEAPTVYQKIVFTKAKE